MVAMYSFCFYFSVRLGSLLVGLFSLIQSLALLVYIAPLTQTDDKELTKQINAYKDRNNVLFLTDYLDMFAKDPKFYVWILLSLVVLHILACLLVIIGAYKCKGGLLTPYLILEMPRLIFLTFSHIAGMMILKENLPDLGILIGLTLLGSFTLLYLFYTWFCVLSLRSILKKFLVGGGNGKEPFLVQPFESSDAPKQQQEGIFPGAGLPYQAMRQGYNNLARPTY